MSGSKHKRMSGWTVLLAFPLLAMTTLIGLGVQVELNPKEQFQRAEVLFAQQNFRDAAGLYREVVGNPQAVAEDVAASLNRAHLAYRRVGMEAEFDSILREAVDTHADSSRVLLQAAKELLAANHYGVMADGVFYRGNNTQVRTRGRMLNRSEQDRLWALQLLRQVSGMADVDRDELAEASLVCAQALLMGRDNRMSWLLQSRTNLEVAPDYTDEEQQSNFSTAYAPVDDNGEPVYYLLPETWESARSDGERLRLAVHVASQSPSQSTSAKLLWARFVESQFSVATLQDSMWLWRAADGSAQNEQGILAIHTLADNETIAKLASGVKRFALPEDYQFLSLYRQLLEQTDGGNADAARALFQVYNNRRQFPKSAEIVEQFPQHFDDETLESIRGPRVEFDSAAPKLAGANPDLTMRFRNLNEISFSARRVDVDKMLLDIQAYFRELNARRQEFRGKANGVPNVESPGNFFRDNELDLYVGPTVAQWTEKVEPRENHWDKRIKITAPIQDAGLYVIEASGESEFNGGTGSHRARLLVWLQDSALVSRSGARGAMVQMLDAESGRPIPNAVVEFFGWRWVQRGNGTQTVQRAARTSDLGLALSPGQADDYQWLTIARQGSRFAVLNFERFANAFRQNQNFDQIKAYGVSERPAYRPGDTVKSKFWLARTVYGDSGATSLSRQSFEIIAYDPNRQVIRRQVVTTDEYGGAEFSFDLPTHATLGRYSFEVQRPNNARKRERISSNLAIRVEEYRKPEFEVNIEAPKQSVALGQTIKARITADYYFGAPVSGARAHVKIERTKYVDSFYPPMPFDWCFGPGYWWLPPRYDWYPGWTQWRGCMPPTPGWMPFPSREPPELVLEQDLVLNNDGEVEVEIDSGIAKQIFGDEFDHNYNITVEVTDNSRRTIFAQGSVVAARDPFKVYCWLDRGFYNAGEQVQVHFQSRRQDGSAVKTTGTLDLLRITYDAQMEPTERTVRSMEVTTDEDGQGLATLGVDEPGQYRVRLRMRDGAEHEVEGGYIFHVRGLGIEGDDLRFNDLQVTPDKMQYAPGDTARLEIASQRDDAWVMVFVRPGQQGYTIPRLVRLEAKTAVLELEITERDQPNLFVEAYCVHDGQLHTVVRELFVPPAERTLQVDLAASKTEYMPGENAALQLSARDQEGKPVQASVVIAAYDRALDQVAPDTLPGDVREFFWKWRRHHYPRSHCNLDAWSYPVSIEGLPSYQTLGIFGHNLADDFDIIEGRNESLGYALGRDKSIPARGRAFGMGGGGMADAMGAAPMALAAPVAAESAMRVEQSPAQNPATPRVRRDFADAAVWSATLETDDGGNTTVDFDLPDNLTSWQVRAWVIGRDVRVGAAEAQLITRKPLLLRLVTPRFMVEGDEVVLSAVVHNDLPTAQTVNVSFEIDGQTQLEMMDPALAQKSIPMAAHEQVRIDLPCRALASGEPVVRASAVCDAASDATELAVPIRVYGAQSMAAWAGTVRDGEQRDRITITVPEERRIEQSELTIQVSPSLAAAMLEPLPYLAEYPYGCTEQTLNRFLPALLTQRALKDLGIDLPELNKRTNLNPQELPGARDPQEGLRAVDDAALREHVAAGIQKLVDSQNADGGWGWFPGAQSRSSAHITSLVTRGLHLAQQAGAVVVPSTIQRGKQWLVNHQRERLAALESNDEPQKRDEWVNNTDALVCYTLTELGESQGPMLNFLFEQREKLSVYGKVLAALACVNADDQPKLALLKRNVEQFLVVDLENETAFLADETAWWYWYGSSVEANAHYLKLLVASQPNDPNAARLVKYLLNNRKHGHYWESTRDTAHAIEAFRDYLTVSLELEADLDVEIWLGDKRLGSMAFTRNNLFTAKNRITLSAEAVPAGEHQLEIRRSGTGNLYWNVYVSNFSREKEIPAAGLEVKIERRYSVLRPAKRDVTLVDSQASVVNAEKAAFDRVPLADLAHIESGQLIEVELLVTSKNDYEYLLIEDNKPAGFEAVDATSGYFFANGLLAYRELRDTHVGLCIENLSRGTHSIKYQLRAETPGGFAALPAQIRGMYAPELAGNSANDTVRIIERGGN